VDIFPKKLQRRIAARQRERVSFREIRDFELGTPLPHPSERLDWRGVCKNALQNLEPQGFRGQNLDNKGLRARFAALAQTASALTMICSLNLEVKVRCHRGGAEN
jgi:hypothetical protein